MSLPSAPPAAPETPEPPFRVGPFEKLLLPLATAALLAMAVFGNRTQNQFVLWCAAVLGIAGLGFCLVTIPGAVRRLRLSRAARRLAEAWRIPADPLPGWPGLREAKDELVARRAGTLLPAGFFFTLPALAVPALSRILGGAGSSGEAVFLAIGIVPPLLALLVGPYGWRLAAGSARQDLRLTRLRPFWTRRERAASLPTVKSIRLEAESRLVIELTRGEPWELEFPPDWPPELGRAFAERLGHLAGIGIETGAATAGGDNSGAAEESEAGGSD